MNAFTEALRKEYKPRLAIMVYSTEERALSGSSYYLESHTINEAGQLLEGKPLQQETIESMVGVFFDERKDRSQLNGYIPENILSYTPMPAGKYKLAWYRPAEIRFIHFAKQLKITSGLSWVPPLVYMVDGGSLRILALKQNSRPKSNARAYRAPFHNVADNGVVCLGSAEVQKPANQSFSAAMKYWEDLFWLSEFSHLNGASNPTKNDLAKVWNKLIAKKPKKKWADIDELKEMKQTSLKSLFQ